MFTRIRCIRCKELVDIQIDTTKQQQSSRIIPYYDALVTPCPKCKGSLIINYEVMINVTAISGPEWDGFLEELEMKNGSGGGSISG